MLDLTVSSALLENCCCCWNPQEPGAFGVSNLSFPGGFEGSKSKIGNKEFLPLFFCLCGPSFFCVFIALLCLFLALFCAAVLQHLLLSDRCRSASLLKLFCGCSSVCFVVNAPNRARPNLHDTVHFALTCVGLRWGCSSNSLVRKGGFFFFFSLSLSCFLCEWHRAWRGNAQ